MHDSRASKRGFLADIDGWLETVQRLLSHQNELWLRALRAASDGSHHPTRWIADVTDIAQQWQAAFRDHVAGVARAGATANLPNVFFEVDGQAECADAKPMHLSRSLSPPTVRATPLRSLDGALSEAGACVTVRHFPGNSQVLVGLAGLRKLAAGRYISLLEDNAGQSVGVVFVKRA